MGTSAAVFIEGIDRTVRINEGGAPSVAVPLLERLIAEEKVVVFGEFTEFAHVYATPEEYAAAMARPGLGLQRYIHVDSIGLAYDDEEASLSPVLPVDEAGIYSRSAEDYTYVITLDGELLSL